MTSGSPGEEPARRSPRALANEHSPVGPRRSDPTAIALTRQSANSATAAAADRLTNGHASAPPRSDLSTASVPKVAQPSRPSQSPAVGADPASTTCGWPDQDLTDLADRMAHSIQVKDRYRHFKKYQMCFTGRQAVAWLLENAQVARDEAEAIHIGNAMLQLGLLHHVLYKHPFENRSHLYRFDGVGPDHDLDASSDDDHSHQGWNMKLRSTNKAGWTPGQEITRLQRRAASTAAEAQVLRATDGLLHEGQMRLARSHRALARRLDAVVGVQERTQFNTAVVALLQTAALLLLVLLLYCNGGSGGEVGGVGMGHDGRLWLPALALLPAVPLLFYLWEECCRPGRRRAAAANAADDEGGLSEALLGNAPHLDSDHSGSSRSGGDDGDMFFSDECGTRPPSSATSEHSHESADGPDVPDASLFEGWRDAPGLLRLKPGLRQHLTDGSDPSRIPLNTATSIRFETDRFVGSAAIWVRDLPSAPEGLFGGKRRRSRVSIQGQFKQRICMEDVITGQEFSRSTNMPARWLVDQVLVKVARAINRSVEIGDMSAPSVLVPVVAMAQGFVVSEAGQQPDLFGEDTEDARLLGPQFQEPSGAPASVDKRKAYFGNADNRRKTFFETDKVYTFHIFQHLVNLGKYELDLSVYRFDLAHYLDGQPLQFMMRPRGDKAHPYFAFEMWHRKLLPAANRYHG